MRWISPTIAAVRMNPMMMVWVREAKGFFILGAVAIRRFSAGVAS
jgi:uncharacterized membrane protein YcfT